MANNDVRAAVLDTIRRDLDAHKLSDKAMPEMVIIKVIYPHSHTELIVDLKTEVHND